MTIRDRKRTPSVRWSAGNSMGVITINVVANKGGSPVVLVSYPAGRRRRMPSGSFGPTTAGRMDSYVEAFQAAGGSMVMLAKGNRSRQVTNACKKHGGFYLGSIGGPAAILAQNNIKKVGGRCARMS